MRPSFRPGTITALGLALLSMGPRPTWAANPPAGALAACTSAQAAYGTIKGRLVWGGSEVPAPRVMVEQGRATKDPEVCARNGAIIDQELVVDPATRGVANGFAYLIRPQGANPDAVKALLERKPKVELDQKGCQFTPFALALHQDQALLVKSSDPVNHNVRYAAFTNSPFNQILSPNGQAELKLVAERRPIVVACDIHPWMKAYLMVFDHSFFAVTGTDGSFEIAGVPAGEQHLVLWQGKVGYVGYRDPAKKTQGMPVTVRAGEVTDVGPIKLELGLSK